MNHLKQHLQKLQTLFEFALVMTMMFGMLYIEVIVYLVILFKEFLCNC